MRKVKIRHYRSLPAVVILSQGIALYFRTRMSTCRLRDSNRLAKTPMNLAINRSGTTIAKQPLGSIHLFEEETTMLWTVFVILLVLWLVGLVSSYTMGGFIHLLLVLAVVVLILNLVTGRRTV